MPEEATAAWSTGGQGRNGRRDHQEELRTQSHPTSKHSKAFESLRAQMLLCTERRHRPRPPGEHERLLQLWCSCRSCKTAVADVGGPKPSPFFQEEVIVFSVKRL